MTLVVEAERFARHGLACARGVRNGLMVALLALCPMKQGVVHPAERFQYTDAQRVF
jgi:hypothetical protein